MRYGIRGRELARFAVGTNNTNGFEVPEVFMVSCAEFDIMGRVGRGRGKQRGEQKQWKKETFRSIFHENRTKSGKAKARLREKMMGSVDLSI